MQHGHEQLRDWQRRRGFNQREASDFLGVNVVFYSQILNGKRQPGLANAIRLEQQTGISVESWVLTEVSESPEPLAATADNPQISKA